MSDNQVSEGDLGLHKRANDRVRPSKANYHRLPSGSGEATSSTYAGVQSSTHL